MISHYELLQRMGSMTSDAEADAFKRILKENGIDWQSESALDDLPDEKWYAFMLEALEDKSKP